MYNPSVCMNDVVVSPCCREREELLKMAVISQFQALFEIFLKKISLEFGIVKN